jgi:hypothetical protein
MGDAAQSSDCTKLIRLPMKLIDGIREKSMPQMS